MLGHLSAALRVGFCLPLLAGFIPAQPVNGQRSATVTVGTRTLDTYAFAEPNPLPMLTRDARLYPYHGFEGYTNTPAPREWTVITLENEWIEVWVLPEIGGKVWGARVKETGHEFIYRNEVLKFRNIALRGPWTSGGIEFNFGVIGHTPATATPVEHLVRQNEDGSASVFVGAMDLPSRTHWRVEVRLPADAAYFETRAQWQNPTQVEHPYYNWMTGAAFARDDLVLTIPGNAYLEHPGGRRDWPIDAAGRQLPVYDQNRFGGNKSYHVVGKHDDFFGGYYVDDDYGFGHWSRYEDMPGQKLWLWALSRQGGIWEDLLTDTDGQYVEFQAGRLFVQYSPTGEVNPISEAGFHPGSSDRWTETWFPVEGLGGLSEAARDGAMFVRREGTSLSVAAHAFVNTSDTLVVTAGADTLHVIPVDMAVLTPMRWDLDVPEEGDVVVRFARLGLRHATDPRDGALERPFETPPDALPALPWVTRTATRASELVQGRRLSEARRLYRSVLDVEPWHRDALVGLADLEFRRGTEEEGIDLIHRALQLDAYDAEANFTAGNLYRAAGQWLDAREAFGWAARSPAYRSAANVELATLALASGEVEEAIRYAGIALDYDRYSLPALHALAIASRMIGRDAMAAGSLDRIAELDPLSLVPIAERWLGGGSRAPESGGEYGGQELLELGLAYARMGRKDDAAAIFSLDSNPATGPLARAWLAHSSADPAALGVVDVDLVFPYRQEMLPVLRWAKSASDHWSWAYLHGLALWGRDRPVEAAAVFDALGATPDFAPFFSTRAALRLQGYGVGDAEEDLRTAVALAPDERLLRIPLIQYLHDQGRWEDALLVSGERLDGDPAAFDLALLHVRALNQVGRSSRSIEILDEIEVLPSEHSAEAHQLFADAHLMRGLDALDRDAPGEAVTHFETAMTWPERLGQGRPYEPEERLARFLSGVAFAHAGELERARDAWRSVLEASVGLSRGELNGRLDLLGVIALERLGRGDTLHELGGDQDEALDEATQAIVTAVRSGRPVALAIVDFATDTPTLFSDLEGRLLVRAFAAASTVPATR